MGLASKSCEGLAVIWTEKMEFLFSVPHLKLVRKTDWIWVKTFFFFWRSPNFGRKNSFIFGEDLFFGYHHIFTKKPPQSDSRLMKTWVKFVYCCFQLQKKPPPPPCEFLAMHRNLRGDLYIFITISSNVLVPTSKRKNWNGRCCVISSNSSSWNMIWRTISATQFVPAWNKITRKSCVVLCCSNIESKDASQWQSTCSVEQSLSWCDLLEDFEAVNLVFAF